MRGLSVSVTTALLLGPTLAWATWLPKPSDLRRYAFITLEPSSHDSAETPEPIFLRVQVNPSGLRCEDASVTLQQYDLYSVTGKPEFTRFQFQTWNRPADHPDGRWGNFTAGWAYDCPAFEEPDTEMNRTMLVTVGSVGGVIQPDLDFALHFRQGSEPEILSISGPKHHIYSGNDKYDHEAHRYKAITEDFWPSPDGKAMPSRPTEFYSEVGLGLKVESAKMTPEILEDGIYPSRHAPSPGTYIFSSNMMEMGEELRDFQEDHPARWRIPGLDRPSGHTDTHETSSTGHREQDPLTTTTSNEAITSSSPDSSMAAFSEKLSSLLGDQDLVTVLGAAVVFFGILSLLCASFFHRRLMQKAEEDNSRNRRRWWHGRRRRETVFERLARRANRRHARVEAAKAWFRAVFGRLFSGDVEKEAADQQAQQQAQQQQQQQQQQQLQPRQQPRQQPLRQQRTYPHLVETIVAEPQRPVTVHDEEQTTMEQELAQFRAAASMVGDLIAAEEGRSRRNPAPPPVPRRHRSSVSMESEISDCDTLPTYEESAPTGSVISDGFGFMPGSSAIVPSSSLESNLSESNNSDRLGYNK